MKTFLFLISICLSATVGIVLYQHEAGHLTTHTERLRMVVETATD